VLTQSLDLILLARWRRSSCRVLIGILALPLMVPLALVLASISIVTGFPLCSKNRPLLRLSEIRVRVLQ